MWKIEIGGGEVPAKNYLNVDIRKSEYVDIVASALYLPFKTDSVDIVLAEHLIEHLGKNEAPLFLKEVKRILKQGGTIIIRAPDFRALVEAYLERGLTGKLNNCVILNGFYGAQKHQYDYHKSGYDKERLHSLMATVGFKEIHTKRSVRNRFRSFSLESTAKKL